MTTTLRFRVLLALWAIAIGLTLAPTTSADSAARQAATRPALVDLQRVDELKAMFNRDAGKVRLVLLLSPT